VLRLVRAVVTGLGTVVVVAGSVAATSAVGAVDFVFFEVPEVFAGAFDVGAADVVSVFAASVFSEVVRDGVVGLLVVARGVLLRVPVDRFEVVLVTVGTGCSTGSGVGFSAGAAATSVTGSSMRAPAELTRVVLRLLDAVAVGSIGDFALFAADLAIGANVPPK